MFKICRFSKILTFARAYSLKCFKLFFVSCINSEFERSWWLTFGSALMKLPLCLMPSKQKDLLSLQSSRSNAQNRVSLRLFLKFKLCFLSEKEMIPESYCKICQTLFSKSKVRDKSITKIYVVWKKEKKSNLVHYVFWH